MTKRSFRRPSFTLVEMLVVIAIIGILLSLVTVAGYTAVKHVRAHTISVDVNNLEGGLTAYKAKTGDFPVDFSDAVVFDRHLRKIFPRHRENVANWLTLGTNNQLDESEALVFFLGGGLYDNPEFPLTGPGQRKKFYDFPTNRLVDLDGDTHLSFVQAYGAAPSAYVYFDSRTYSVGLWDRSAANQGVVRPYRTDTTGPPNPTTWEAADTFQIVAAGLDGHYGDLPPGGPPAPYKQFPSGVFYTLQDRDNVASFAEGALESRLP